MMGCGWRIGPLPLGRSSLVRRTILFENKGVGLYERKLLKEGTESCAGSGA